MTFTDSRGRVHTERPRVGRLVRAIESRYLPRSRWDLRLWLWVLARLDRHRYVWRTP